MPFTPYHFGPSGLIGLTFKKWLDVPVFVLANVIVDLEVIGVNFFELGWPIHRYFHTLLIGALVGVVWGLLAYPFRGLFTKIMRFAHLAYKPSLLKMMVSGVLGVWLHVLIDSVYHGDVLIFRPARATPLWNLLSRSQVRTACLVCLAAAIVLYLCLLVMDMRKSRRG